jgi:hypothetical protein
VTDTTAFVEIFADHLNPVQEVFEQIVAGSDTTAAAIRIILLYVMSHRRVYAKLQAEVDEAVKNGVAPAPPSIISDAEVRQLPYLGAVIREALRVSPLLLESASGFLSLQSIYSCFVLRCVLTRCVHSRYTRPWPTYFPASHLTKETS